MPLAIITGANRGLGYEFARQYIDAGWDVIAINRSASSQLDALAACDKLRVVTAALTDISEPFLSTYLYGRRSLTENADRQNRAAMRVTHA